MLMVTTRKQWDDLWLSFQAGHITTVINIIAHTDTIDLANGRLLSLSLLLLLLLLLVDGWWSTSVAVALIKSKPDVRSLGLQCGGDDDVGRPAGIRPVAEEEHNGQHAWRHYSRGEWGTFSRQNSKRSLFGMIWWATGAAPCRVRPSDINLNVNSTFGTYKLHNMHRHTYKDEHIEREI